MSFYPIIGLEVHTELKTNTKLFCGCPNKFGAEPNTNVCPVCLGLPGTLPVVNKKAVDLGVLAALSLNCKVASFSKFDRKNYFYPDMPKNYQISQYDLPLASDGYITIDTDDTVKKIRIKRMHLEEDTGKSIHLGTIDKSLYTLEDYNRAGVPLLEIVTEPDVNSPQEAYELLQNLKKILQWIDISDCKMEEGSLRCDANISLKSDKATQSDYRIEVKNMNSFKSVQKALEYEIKRQKKLLEKDQPIEQETRGWDESKQITILLRSKEQVQDYRYFPEPDLLPLEISSAEVEEHKTKLPELPQEREQRFISQYNLNKYDAEVLNSSYEVSEFFEKTIKLFDNPKEICNWIMSDISKLLNAKGLELNQTKLTPENLAKLLKMIKAKTISGKIAKSILEEVIESGSDPEIVVKEKGLAVIANKEELIPLAQDILKDNAKLIEDYRKGKEKALDFLIGLMMRATKGKASPAIAREILQELLK